MSLNKYMHPRNIYKTPPNFKQLAIDYPEFRAYIKQDLSGKVSIDFKDLKALRALTCTLLQKDFGLDVEIPLTRMIPTVPLRLNYILWIEDLLSISGNDNHAIRGIDIGTGASCIYSLLAAKSKGWSMIASDVDQESINFALKNVQKNLLNNLITVKKVEEKSLLKEALGDDQQEIDFCMCNPPFFASTQELNPSFKARRPDRPRPRNAFCATIGEVIADGGEINFVTRMIQESKDLDKKIKIYTSMVGHKSSLPPLKKLLREADVMSFKQTEFYQGHTARWALAWTFHDIDLRKVPEATVVAARKSKPKPPLQYIIPFELTLKKTSEKLIKIFNNLQMDYNLIKENKNLLLYSFTASSNTWSHQRRKRREQERLNVVLTDNNNERECVTPTPSTSSEAKLSPDINGASEKVAQMKVHSPKSPLKRDLEDEGYYNCKRVKLQENEEEEFYLKSSVIVRKEDSNILVELLFLEGSAGKEGLYQILQYIKNNFKD